MYEPLTNTFSISYPPLLDIKVRVENLTKERDMLRQAEGRLSKEKDAVLAEQRNQNLLLTNLKTIQVSHQIAFIAFLMTTACFSGNCL